MQPVRIPQKPKPNTLEAVGERSSNQSDEIRSGAMPRPPEDHPLPKNGPGHTEECLQVEPLPDGSGATLRFTADVAEAVHGVQETLRRVAQVCR